MFDNVVVGATDSAGSAEALRRAIEVTQVSGGTLHIVTAFKSHRPTCPTMPEEFRYSIGSVDPVDYLLSELADRAGAAAVRVATHPVLARPVDAITKVATEEHADLIVVGGGAGHGSGHRTNVSKRIVAKAHCAVLVV